MYSLPSHHHRAFTQQCVLTPGLHLAFDRVVGISPNLGHFIHEHNRFYHFLVCFMSRLPGLHLKVRPDPWEFTQIKPYIMGDLWQKGPKTAMFDVIMMSYLHFENLKMMPLSSLLHFLWDRV